MNTFAVFEPDEIRAVCNRDLPAGLRTIAAALEAGELEGRVLSCGGVGGRGRDERAHVLLQLDLAAEIVGKGEWKDDDQRDVCNQRVALPEVAPRRD